MCTLELTALRRDPRPRRDMCSATYAEAYTVPPRRDLRCPSGGRHQK